MPQIQPEWNDYYESHAIEIENFFGIIIFIVVAVTIVWAAATITLEHHRK